MNDSVPDKVEVAKFNLPADTLLLLELAHGPESAAVKTMWTKLQTYAKKRGAIPFTYQIMYHHGRVICYRKIK